MLWEGREESSNVEDRRGMGPAGLAIGGGGSILLMVLGLMFGFDPRMLIELLNSAERAPTVQSGARRPDPREDRAAAFTKVILRDTEIVWGDLFQRAGRAYEPPRLILFSGAVDSACGMADAAVGPFYCPADRRVYIDLSFFRDMERQLNSPGDFARAYVIAHEVGHHVQRLLGYSSPIERMRRTASRTASNRLSVQLELQADYLAGVWAHHGQRRFNFLERGDVQSAMRAAFEIGDDRLQRKARGYVVPDSFTHGSSAQRQRAFSDGLRTGDLAAARAFVDAVATR